MFLTFAGVLEEINEDVNESVRTGAFDSRPDYHCARFPMLLTDRTCKRAHEIGDKYLTEMMALAEEASEELGDSDNPKPIGVTASSSCSPRRCASAKRRLRREGPRASGRRRMSDRRAIARLVSLGFQGALTGTRSRRLPDRSDRGRLND
jgi:hypothetical protein